jgi:hypothetical protein
MQAQYLPLAAYIATGVGLFLIAVSLIFPWVFPDVGAWSQANADEFSQAAREYYRLGHEYAAGHGHSHTASGADPAVTEEQLKAARDRFESLKERKNSAVSGRHTTQSLVKWAGILLAGAGISAAVAMRFGGA